MSSICCLCLLSKQDKDPQADVYYENEEQNEETLHEEVEDVVSVKTQDEILQESSTYGVHYSMIQKILISLSEEVTNEATTGDVIRDVVKTNEKLSAAKVSWLDLLTSEDAHDENGTPLYGKANVFISHTWRYKFKDTAESVIKYAQEYEEETGEQCYIWMDMFLLNQFSTDSFDSNWLKETFTNVIKDINNTVVIMTPFESPMSVKRVWCLWELYLSVQYSKFNIVLPPEQSIRFHDALLQNPYSVTEMYTQIGLIRAEEAEAFDPKDKDMIFAIIKETIGFDKLNSVVISTIKKWIEDQCQMKLDAINNGEVDAEEALAAPTHHCGKGSTLFRSITIGSVGLTKLSLLHPDVKHVINGTRDSWPPFANALTSGMCDIADLIIEHPSFNFGNVHWQIDMFIIKESPNYCYNPDFNTVPHERVEQSLRKYFEMRYAAGFEEFLDYDDFVDKSKSGELKKLYPGWVYYGYRGGVLNE